MPASATMEEVLTKNKYFNKMYADKRLSSIVYNGRGYHYEYIKSKRVDEFAQINGT